MSSPLCFGVGRGELEERLDAQFYQPKYLELEHKLKQCPYPVQHLRDLALQIVDGPFGSQLKVEEYVPDGIPLVRVSDVKTGELVDNGLVFITPEKQEQLKRSRLLPGDVILTKAGAILGYSAVFPDRWPEGNITSHSVSIRCKDTVRNRYLSFYLRSEFGNQQIYRWGSKSTRPELNTEEVEHILVVVPPLDFQDAIADKMDAAYQCKRELEAKAKALLKGIGGYVLGELGTEWGKPPDQGKPVGHEAVWFGAWRRDVKRLDPKRYRYQREGPAPKGMRRLGDLLTRRREKVDRSKYAFEDLQLISLHFDGSMSERDVKAWRKDITGTLWFAYPGDLVYSKIDARNGAIGLVPDELGRIAVTSEFPVYQVKEGISAEYLKIVLRTPQFTGLLQAMAAGHSGRKRIQPRELEDVLIPVPLLNQQRKIAVEVQTRQEQAQALREKAELVVAEAEAEMERMILGE